MQHIVWLWVLLLVFNLLSVLIIFWLHKRDKTLRRELTEYIRQRQRIRFEEIDEVWENIDDDEDFLNSTRKVNWRKEGF